MAAKNAQLESEIARLTASINQHKAQQYPGRRNTYVNPNSKPSNKYVRQPTASTSSTSAATPSYQPPPPPGQVKDVVIDGVAFESSSRSLVRKDLPRPKPPSTGPLKPSNHPTAPQAYSRRSGHLVPPGRSYKPKGRRVRRGQNMTLTNNRRPYQARLEAKKKKYSEKPCPRFTTTGSCSRGLTCYYQHDPSKIAICWKFLQGNCSNTAETCNLSHDPTPERTPLCHHFINKGRCTRENCPFPHVNVGPREGVCRDFAVLGFCAKGLDCEHQHVRECPDFAEKGTCTKKGCKLPHVIRANRHRKAAAAAFAATAATTTDEKESGTSDPFVIDREPDPNVPRLTANDAQLGDEFISLTFNESESEEDSEEDEEGSEDEDGDEDGDGEVDDEDSEPSKEDSNAESP